MPYLVPCSAACVTKADIVFLVDGSGSINPPDFSRVKQFLHSFIDGLVIGPDKVRIGLAQYNHRPPQQEFLLKNTTDKRSLLEKVDKLRQLGGGTNTGQGIAFLQSNYFTKEAGSRADEGVAQVVVLITDGPSEDDVVGPSLALRNQGVIMFAIGVGDYYDEDQLMSIVSQPHEQFLIKVDSYQNLQGVKDSLLHTVCSSVTEPVSTPVPDLYLPGKLLSPPGETIMFLPHVCPFVSESSVSSQYPTDVYSSESL